MRRERPLVVIEGHAKVVGSHLEACLVEARRRGWSVIEGWGAPLVGERVVCSGPIASADDARRALLAAITGAGLVVAWQADMITRDRFLDDLRRLGSVDHLFAEFGRHPDALRVHDLGMAAARPAPRPIIVVEGSEEAVAAVRAEIQRKGWRVRPDFGRVAAAGVGVVRTGVVATAEDAAAALIAVLSGSGVIIDGRADREVMDRLLDDLRHIGPVDHRVSASSAAPAIDDESRALLTRLADGETLGEAAHALGLSRRTADRRLADARRAMGVERTAEAVSRAQRLGLLR